MMPMIKAARYKLRKKLVVQSWIGARNLPPELPDSEKGEENIGLFYIHQLLNDVTPPQNQTGAGLTTQAADAS
jgi:hypothetical protein